MALAGERGRVDESDLNVGVKPIESGERTRRGARANASATVGRLLEWRNYGASHSSLSEGGI